MAQDESNIAHGGYLGPILGCAWAVLDSSWAIWTYLGPMLGHKWAVLGSSWAICWAICSGQTCKKSHRRTVGSPVCTVVATLLSLPKQQRPCRWLVGCQLLPESCTEIRQSKLETTTIATQHWTVSVVRETQRH